MVNAHIVTHSLQYVTMYLLSQAAVQKALKEWKDSITDFQTPSIRIRANIVEKRLQSQVTMPDLESGNWVEWMDSKVWNHSLLHPTSACHRALSVAQSISRFKNEFQREIFCLFSYVCSTVYEGDCIIVLFYHWISVLVQNFSQQINTAIAGMGSRTALSRPGFPGKDNSWMVGWIEGQMDR